METEKSMPITAEQFNKLRDDTESRKAMNTNPINALLKQRVDEHMRTLQKELQGCQPKVLFTDDEAYLPKHGPWDANNKYLQTPGESVFINAQPDQYREGCNLTIRLGFGQQKTVHLYFGDNVLMAEALRELSEFVYPSPPAMHQPVEEEAARQAAAPWPYPAKSSAVEPEYQRELREQEALKEKNRQDHEELRRMLGL